MSVQNIKQIANIDELTEELKDESLDRHDQVRACSYTCSSMRGEKSSQAKPS